MNGLGAFSLLLGGGWFALTAVVVAAGLFHLRGENASGRADKRFLWWLVAVRSLTSLVGISGGLTGGTLCLLGLDRLFAIDVLDVSDQAIAAALGAGFALWLLGASALSVTARSIPRCEAEGDVDAF